MVFLPFQEPRFFQPGDRNPDFRIGVGSIRVDPMLFWNLQENFTARDYNVPYTSVFSFNRAKGFEN